MTFKLILLRHGQSTWNASNIFTGWADVPLSNKGLQEARNAGLCLAESGILPGVLHTSLLRRAINTAGIALDVADRHWIAVKRSWRLNERHYGRLQGENKDDAADKFGAEQVRLWRRSYDVPPPAMESDVYTRQLEPRYYMNGSYVIPETESLRDVMDRIEPYWRSDIIPDLKKGQTVLIVAHGNSLRALIKLLDNLSDEETSEKEFGEEGYWINVQINSHQANALGDKGVEVQEYMTNIKTMISRYRDGCNHSVWSFSSGTEMVGLD